MVTPHDRGQTWEDRSHPRKAPGIDALTPREALEALYRLRGLLG